MDVLSEAFPFQEMDDECHVDDDIDDRDIDDQDIDVDDDQEDEEEDCEEAHPTRVNANSFR